MKITVVAIFSEYERTFEVSCGTGENKTFKWLSNVVCQRFALAAPNGTLRHRDQFRGITNHTQHTAVEISLFNGQIPHPAAILSDFLRDGDEVRVKLISELAVDSLSGYSQPSKWSSVAFTTTSGRRNTKGVGDEDEDPDADEVGSALAIEIEAKAQFMRLVLGSQMLNQKRIQQEVNSRWGVVEFAMPRLPLKDNIALKSLFQEHWCLLSEVYQHFAPDGNMALEGFKSFVDAVELFSKRDSAILSTRVHRRACFAAGGNSGSGDGVSSLSIGSFFVALIICAQLRHNDTFEHDSEITCAHEAVQDILENYVVPCAEELTLPSVLKKSFCTDDVLAGIRAQYEELFAVFEKFASRSHQLPTSLRIENMTECLYHAGLVQDIRDYRRVTTLFAEARRGMIIGRNQLSAVLQESKYDEIPPEDELIFPEFVEVAARAGYAKYFLQARLNKSLLAAAAASAAAGGGPGGMGSSSSSSKLGDMSGFHSHQSPHTPSHSNYSGNSNNNNNNINSHSSRSGGRGGGSSSVVMVEEIIEASSLEEALLAGIQAVVSTLQKKI